MKMRVRLSTSRKSRFEEVASFAIGILLISSQALQAEEPTSAVDFETIPPETFLDGSAITLSAPTNVKGTFSVDGIVSTNDGVQFSDGTLQTTAPAPTAAKSTVESFSANQGIYDNRVPDISPSRPYTEICITATGILFDIHEAGEATSGGNCEPDDIGWIIERSERQSGSEIFWTEARLDCLLDGMRLPEPFEWQIACDREALLGLSGFVDGSGEWSSNSTSESSLSMNVGAAAFALGHSDDVDGGSGCNFGGLGFLVRVNGTRNVHQYRCVR